MSLVTQLQAGFTRIAQEVNTLRSEQAMKQLERVDLAVDTVSIDFQNILQTYNSLRIIANVRGTVASAFANLHINMNNVTSDVSYYSQYIQGNGGASSAGEARAAAASRRIGIVPAAFASSGSFAIVEILIPEYTKTDRLGYSMATQFLSWSGDANGLTVRHSGVVWANQAAINRITLNLNAGSFEEGSVATLYGLK